MNQEELRKQFEKENPKKPCLPFVYAMWLESKLLQSSIGDEEIEKWVNTSERTPITYKEGNWDGKNSDQVIAETKLGVRHLAHFCEGFMDGSEFKDWYDSNDYLIETEVVKWLKF